MLKKWLASIGIGNAKVDTQLDNTRIIPGELFGGKVVIEGGSAAQKVDRINLFLMTEAVREKDDKKYYESVKLQSFTVGEPFTINEGEKKEIDFKFVLPVQTPPTIGRTKVWIQTGLDVPNAIDPTDRDFVQVVPHPFMNRVLEALTDVLQFRLHQSEMKYSRKFGYSQEFEFLPNAEFRRDLDELEVNFFLKENSVELVLQVDRRAKGLGGFLAEALDMDESFVKMTFTKEEIEQGTSFVAEKLRATIRQYS